jgi:hypothetical protein
MRLADGAVKAVSRAQRGRSNAERLDRADANFTIGLDGPRTDKADLGRHLRRVFWTASQSGKTWHRRTSFIRITAVWAV